MGKRSFGVLKTARDRFPRVLQNRATNVSGATSKGRGPTDHNRSRTAPSDTRPYLL